MEIVQGTDSKEAAMQDFTAFYGLLEQPNSQLSIFLDPQFIEAPSSYSPANTAKKITFIASLADISEVHQSVTILHGQPDIDDNFPSVSIEVERDPKTEEQNRSTKEKVFLMASQSHTYIRHADFERFEKIAKALNPNDLSLLADPESSQEVMERMNTLLKRVKEPDLRSAVLNAMVGSICFANFYSAGRGPTHYR